ncbi:MAG TPA: CAP domain-containing protein, partial [Baekduia sp.]|nr:CAP domain-containing protein [Baekduia sp.]
MSSFKPFAAACAALLTLALPSAASAASCPGADLQPNHGDFFAVADDATLCLLNEQRAAHGLSALRPGPESLAAPARLYAQDLVTRRFFAHVSPDGVTLAQRLAAYAVGSDWAIGENLAWGEAGLATPASIVDAWMKSPGHRANILNGEFKEIGIGVVPGAPKNDAYL